MNNKRITLTICEVCEKLGIDYKPGHKELYNDAKRLGQIFLELKVIAGDLQSISDRHKIDGLQEILHTEALNIEKIDHEVCKIAAKLIKHNDD